MQKNLSDFDRIYLINLKRNPDRREKFLQDNEFILKHLSNFEIFDAVDGNDITNPAWKWEKGALGCLESHLKILKDAKEKNYKEVVILEDDFIFDQNFNREFSKGFNELDPNWDMLYMYVHQIADPQKFSKHLEKLSCGLGTVAYMVNEKAYDLLINVLELRTWQVDVTYGHMHFLINAYTFKKNICSHIEGVSNIQNTGANNNESFVIKAKVLLKSTVSFLSRSRKNSQK